jgi:hypothetical protein
MMPDVVGSFFNRRVNFPLRHALGSPRSIVDPRPQKAKSILANLSGRGRLDDVSPKRTDTDVLVLLDSPAKQSFNRSPLVWRKVAGFVHDGVLHRGSYT